MDSDLIEYFNEKYLAPNDNGAMVAVLRGTQKLGVNLDLIAESQVPILMAAGSLDPNSIEALELQESLTNINVLLIPEEDHVGAVSAQAFVSGIKEFLLYPQVRDKE